MKSKIFAALVGIVAAGLVIFIAWAALVLIAASVACFFGTVISYAMAKGI